MPTINRREIKPKKVKYKKKGRSEDFYNSEAWKSFRKTYISLHPLCSICLSHNVITPTEELHHIRPFLTGETEEEQWELFLKESNIISTCKICHSNLHKKIDKYNLLSCSELTDTEYNIAHYIIE